MGEEDYVRDEVVQGCTGLDSVALLETISTRKMFIMSNMMFMAAPLNLSQEMFIYICWMFN